MAEWDIERPIDPAESALKQLEGRASKLEAAGQSDYLASERLRLKTELSATGRRRELIYLFWSFGLLAGSQLVAFACKYLTEGAAPHAPRLDGTYFEGWELVFGVVQICSKLASVGFGFLVLFLLVRFLWSLRTDRMELAGVGAKGGSALN
ncbi:hypothetical protein [Haloferula sp.]|uniref:hypothetical protein n=1 Tax=Haloferula sp. TaxID=2497595 RepID=UPI00329F28BF